MNPRTVVLVLAVGLAFPLAACSSQKREAGSLVEAVDRFRKADMTAKGPLADAIEAVGCTDAEVCAAKEACMAAARPTAQGAALKTEVALALAQLKTGRISQAEAASKGLPEKLDDSSRLLDEGRANLTECDRKTVALRVKYAL